MGYNSADWPHGEPLLRVTHSYFSVVLLLPLLASLVLYTPPTLTVVSTTAASTFWIAIFVTEALMWKKLSSGPVDLEIEYLLGWVIDKP